MSRGIYKLREQSTLTPCDGFVESVSETLPDFLSEPLVLGDGVLKAKHSDNGVVIPKDKKLFKLRGCYPCFRSFNITHLLPGLVKVDNDYIDAVDRRMEQEDCSLGSLSLEESEREIQAQEQLENKLREYNLPAPLTPLARYDYGSDENEGYCVVSSSRGDLRLAELILHFVNSTKIIKDYPEQLSRIHQWLGFSHGLIKDMNVNKTELSNNIGTYVFYDIPHGYGLSRVGFDKQRAGNDFVLVKGHDLGELNHRLKEYIVSKDLTSLIQENDGRVTFGTSDEEVVFEQEGQLFVVLTKEQVPSLERNNELFDRGYSGELPKPISKKFVHEVLNNSSIEV